MKRLNKLRSTLSFHLVGFFVLTILILSAVIGGIGLNGFSSSFKKEYTESTYHMAETAATLVNGDSIDRYLTEGADEEYLRSAGYLDTYCDKMHVSLVYVIKVDPSDYGSFVSVFNAVNNTVDNTNYTPWELGYRRETTNDEYRQKYKAICEDGSDSEVVYRTSNLHGTHPHITTMVPVKGKNGAVTAILCIQRPMRELEKAIRPFLILIVLSALTASVIAALLAVGFLRRHFVKPIRTISAEAMRFASENKQGEPLEGVSKIEEIANLARSIDTMEADMLRHIDNITSFTAEQERIGAELSVAATIQENSVPNVFPAFPDREDFDIFASMTPAKEVGGDFYNFFLKDEDHLTFVIGDVSGKGIPASLFMMVTNILITTRTETENSPGKILSIVNDRICEHNKADMFVTLWLGILDLKTGNLTFANGGHDDAAICRRDGSFELYKTRHGLVVGAMHGIKYQDFELHLNEGDKLFLYTDGVPEATDRNEQMFLTDRMLEALNRYKDQPPCEILSGVKRSVDEFVGDAPQFDDLTMLCVERKAPRAETATLTVDASTDRLDDILAFTEGFLGDAGSPKMRMQLQLVIEEIFVNIAHYAYPDGAGEAQITLEKRGDTLAVSFKDSGTPYDPLKKPDPDTTLSAEERPIGGLGIFMVKKMTESVSYRREEGFNILSFTKKLDE